MVLEVTLGSWENESGCTESTLDTHKKKKKSSLIQDLLMGLVARGKWSLIFRFRWCLSISRVMLIEREFVFQFLFCIFQNALCQRIRDLMIQNLWWILTIKVFQSFNIMRLCHQNLVLDDSNLADICWSYYCELASIHHHQARARHQTQTPWTALTPIPFSI